MNTLILSKERWFGERFLIIEDEFVDKILPTFKSKRVNIIAGLKAMVIFENSRNYNRFTKSITIAGCDIYFDISFSINPLDFVVSIENVENITLEYRIEL